MRNINKWNEPQSLTEHRSKQHSFYENYSDKSGLRIALVNEQQWLCCYCMGRIKPDEHKMKIEHWQCQANYQERELDYRNLLGACLGGEGQPPRDQHCDTRKRDDDLLFNPAEASHAVEGKVQYGADGTISSINPIFDDQLNRVLNLNLAILKRNRKGVLDVVLAWWKKEKNKCRGPVPRESLERMIDKSAGAYGKLTPFCQVAVWWLSIKLYRG